MADISLAQSRHYRRMKFDPPASNPHAFLPFTDARKYGAFLGSMNYFTWPQAVDFLYRSALPDKNMSEFSAGWGEAKTCVHFVGFRGEEYWSAVRIWGKPDYTWDQASFRILGEAAPQDTVIFGPSAFNTPKKWRAAR